MIIKNINTGYDSINPIRPGNKYVVVSCTVSRDVTLGKTKIHVELMQEELVIAYFSYDYNIHELYTYVNVYGSNLLECFGYLQRELAGVMILNLDKLMNYLDDPKVNNRTIVTLVDGKCAILGSGTIDKRESIKKVRPKKTERITEIRLPINERVNKMAKRAALVGDDLNVDYGILLKVDKDGGIKSNGYLRFCDYYVCNNAVYRAKFELTGDTNIAIKCMHRLAFNNKSDQRIKVYVDRASIIRDCTFVSMDLYIKNADIIAKNEFIDCNIYMQDCLYVDSNKHYNNKRNDTEIYDNIGELHLKHFDATLNIKVSRTKFYDIQAFSSRVQLLGKLDPRTSVYIGDNPGGAVLELEDPLIYKRVNSHYARLIR